MNFSQFVEWAFYGITGGAFVYLVSILAHIKTSIDSLNQNVAIVIEKTSWHEKILDKHEEEIQKIRDRI